jgi:hypothetical protein
VVAVCVCVWPGGGGHSCMGLATCHQAVGLCDDQLPAVVCFQLMLPRGCLRPLPLLPEKTWPCCKLPCCCCTCVTCCPQIFFSVYEMAIDTVLLSFCEDCECNSGHPRCAPTLLLEAIGELKPATAAAPGAATEQGHNGHGKQGHGRQWT